MTDNPGLFRRYLLPSFALKGVIIGGGYATGRELTEYFMTKGIGGALLGMGLATIFWSVVAALTFALAVRFRAFDYRAFMQKLLGPLWFVFEICYIAFAILLLAVFGAAAGEVGASLFGLPTLAGTAFLAVAIAVVAGTGERAVEIMFKYVSVLLYGVYALFLVIAVSKFGSGIGEGLENATVESGWFADGIAYGSYNIVAAVMILPVLRHIVSPRQAAIAGAMAGPMAMLPGFFFLLAMIAFYPAILSETLPSDFLLRQMDIPAFRIAFQVMVFGALLESGVGVVHALNERVANAWKAGGPPRWLRPAMTITLLVACMFIADRIGLVSLIASGYRFMAMVFIFTFILPLLTIGVVRLWRTRAPAQP